MNLDDSRNWASAYAFDGNRDTTASPKPTYQHYDPYSKIFFENTNVYGSAFSDNLSSGLTPGPLIALSQPGSGSGTSPSNNVTNIDLYVYASTETGNYTEPVGANYLKPLGADYLIPTQTSGLSVLVNGQAAGLLIREDATIQLGIYTGKNGSGHATFDYVTVETGGNLWQNFSVTGSAGSWSAGADAADPNPPAVGTFVINDLPSPASPAVGGVYWYQLVVGDDTGDQKVYDFYATAASTSPGVISTSDLSVAAGGGATFPPGTLTSSQIQLALNPASTMPSGLLDFVYNSQFSPMPAAPVAGTLAGLVFTAIDGQNGTGNPRYDLQHDRHAGDPDRLGVRNPGLWLDRHEQWNPFGDADRLDQHRAGRRTASSPNSPTRSTPATSPGSPWLTPPPIRRWARR